MKTLRNFILLAMFIALVVCLIINYTWEYMVFVGIVMTICVIDAIRTPITPSKE